MKPQFSDLFSCRATARVAAGLCVSLAIAFGGPRVMAESPKETSLAPAQRALDRGLPEVAVTKLQRLLSSSLDAQERATTRLMLAEALLRSARPAEALEILSGGTAPRGAASDFWRGQALLALERWEDAERALAAAATLGEDPLRTDAELARATALEQMGRLDDAAAILSALSSHTQLGGEARLQLASLRLEQSDFGGASAALEAFVPVSVSQTTQHNYLRARIALATGENERALALFRDVRASPRGANPAIWAGAAIGEARVLGRMQQWREAGDVLEGFIRENPHSPELNRVFQELDSIYARDPDETPTDLTMWMRDTAGERRLFAEYYLARAEARAGREKRAINRLRDLRTAEGAAPVVLQREVLAELGSLLLATRQPGKAIEAFLAAQLVDPSPSFRLWCEFMIGRCSYELDRFDEAIQRFDAAAESPQLADDALYNSALSCIRAGDFDRFLERYAAFSARFPESELRRELIIEQGRFQARAGDSQAAETLETFVRDFSDHPRIGEVLFSLAEFHFKQSPPDIEKARDALTRARARELDPSLADRAFLLEIWIAERSGTPADDLIKRIRTLLTKTRDADVAIEARLKLGELLYGIGDYVAARTEFEAAAAANRERRPLALFLAGRSAMRSMEQAAIEDAIALFEEVARLDDSSLRRMARREQAEVHNLQGRHDEAVFLYDEILKREQDPDARIAALLGKGHSLFAAGSATPGEYRRAIATFAAVAQDASASHTARNEARYMRARAFERLGEDDAALEAYYSVMAQMDEGEETEMYWVYKAGFDAARLLEASERWESAITVYEDLAAMDGPRSSEATERAKQLRLEHFLWENE